MSCQKNSGKFSRAAGVAGGISSSASQTVNLVGAKAQQTATWIKQNPAEATAIGVRYALMAAAFYTGAKEVKKAGRSWQTVSYEVDGRPVASIVSKPKKDRLLDVVKAINISKSYLTYASLLGGGVIYASKVARQKTDVKETKKGDIAIKSVSDTSSQADDRKHIRQILAALDKVEKNVGKPDVKSISIVNDNFALIQDAVSNLPLPKVVKMPIKPFLAGHMYASSGGKMMAFAVPGGHMGFDRKFFDPDRPLSEKQKKRFQTADGGTWRGLPEHIMVHEALHRVPRKKNLLGAINPLRKVREEMLVDAITAELVTPEYKGSRSGYDSIRQMAQKRAGRIAKKTGRTRFDVLVDQLGVDPAAAPKVTQESRTNEL